jgi:GTP pyrophosphokinase
MTKGSPLEIQIRTFAMHQVSEYGVAAHWKYKESGKNSVAGSEIDQKMSWLRQMVSLQQELSDPKEYFEALKVDVFSDEVFVFTPKGDVIDMPKGSTPIDFAYRIHTEVGHHCVGAKVNGKIVQLEYKLKNGDIISIITNKSGNGPSRDWLNIVASSETRSKIRSWFKKEKREENVARGLELIDKAAKHLGYSSKELLKEDRLLAVAQKLNIMNEEDLLAALGYGGISVNGVMKKLIELYGQSSVPSAPPSVNKSTRDIKAKAVQMKAGGDSHGILVEGESGFLVRLAHCCNPIPGDPITGYITRGRGVSVHRVDCPNMMNETDVSRMIDVKWGMVLDPLYTVEIEILCNDQSGVLAEIIAIPSEMKCNISSINTITNRVNKTATLIMGMEVKNSEQIEQIMTRLRRIRDVYSVNRTVSNPVV